MNDDEEELAALLELFLFVGFAAGVIFTGTIILIVRCLT